MSLLYYLLVLVLMEHPGSVAYTVLYEKVAQRKKTNLKTRRQGSSWEECLGDAMLLQSLGGGAEQTTKSGVEELHGRSVWWTRLDSTRLASTGVGKLLTRVSKCGLHPGDEE